MSLKREQIRERPYGAQAVSQLAAGGMHPVLARICAARGVDRPEQMEVDLAGLLHYGTLKGIDAAAMRLAEAVMRQQRVLVVADYDADG
ncbi:MAG: single-stranded-DNA-specific exonuclease RecJ, partial [Betaproteobacteria bacterium]|nr:single-stranded-DNA-specific exonuclease RecJ [Betaproteobacteria bacterium]